MPRTYDVRLDPMALIGHAPVRVFRQTRNNSDTLTFQFPVEMVHLYHEQECCENVSIEDICGDLEDLEGAPIIRCEVRSNVGNLEGKSKDYGHHDESSNAGTWTFIEIATNKGSVTIRFFGVSNGYYSETADFFVEEKAK